jgi:hypothetical protein
VIVLMYLRPYTEWVPAKYAQQAGRGRFLDDFDAFVASRPVRLGDRIERWASVFGWASLHVRTLAEIGGDVLTDVSAVIGAPLPPVPAANVTPAWTAVETARWATRTGGEGRPARPGRPDRPGPPRARACGPGRYLTRAQRQALTDAWRGDLELLAAGTGRAMAPVPADDRSRPWLPTFDRVPDQLRETAVAWLARP